MYFPYSILKNDIKTNTVSLAITKHNIIVVSCATIKSKNGLLVELDARRPKNLRRHSLTHVKYDAWHGRELFNVNVRQNVHQVSFATGGETQSSSGEQCAVGRPECGYRD